LSRTFFTKASVFLPNLKIGLVWADVTHRVDRGSVLALCGEEPMLEGSDTPCTMGVDTGRELHFVISRRIPDSRKRRVVYLGVHSDFSELDDLMRRFRVSLCVSDALPETHATRAFANRHGGRVFLNFFSDSQKGATRWDFAQRMVHENRTEILDVPSADPLLAETPVALRAPSVSAAPRIPSNCSSSRVFIGLYLPALYTKLLGGRCLTHVGREGAIGPGLRPRMISRPGAGSVRDPGWRLAPIGPSPRPAAQRHARPDDFYDAERPCALQEPINGRRHARSCEGQDEGR